MKPIYILLMCFVVSSCSSQNTIDFGSIKTLQQAQAFFNSKQDVPTFKTDYYKSFDKGFWNNIPVAEIVVKNNELSFNNSRTDKNSTIQLIDFLQSTYPNNINKNQGWFSTTYDITTENFDLSLKVIVDNNKEVLENTESELKITFKETFDNKLAQISPNLTSNLNGIEQYLAYDFNNVNYQTFINNLPFHANYNLDTQSSNYSQFLNPFILNAETPITLKIIINPGNNEKGEPEKTIAKKSYFGIFLMSEYANGKNLDEYTIYNNKEYVTDTLIKNGKKFYSSYPGTYQYGKKNKVIKYTFKPKVDYNLKGWSNGKDLRKEQNLEQKIKTFYADFGNLILNKNINELTNLLYQKYYDYYTYTYNVGNTKSYDEYKLWLETVNKTFKIVAAQQTKLHISTDGKLAYLEPIDKAGCIKAVGKNFIRNISFYFYIDSDTNQLKIIR